MNARFVFSFVLLLLGAPWRQEVPPIAITSPAPDAVLRGQVMVTGSVQIPNFVTAELDFAYASNPTNTWFTIQTFSQPVADSTLATWDTTSITDGDYVLRLLVTMEDGTSQEVTVPVKIGNDILPTVLPEATATPPEMEVLVPTPFLLAASPTPSQVPRPTPTALPPNPVSLRKGEIYTSLGRGALVILGLFVLAGLIVRVRRF